MNHYRAFQWGSSLIRLFACLALPVMVASLPAADPLVDKKPPGSVPAFAAALAHFDLEIPVADDSGVIKISSIASEPAKGFSETPGYGAFFWSAGATQLVFQVPPNGATTPNSHYPRTELSQKKEERWKLTSANHTLRGTFALTSVPKIREKGEITLAQIHNDISDNGPLLKLMCDYKSRPWKLVADYRVEPKKSSDIIQTPERQRESIMLSRGIDYEIVLTTARVLTVKVRKFGSKTWSLLADSSKKGMALSPAWDGETCYFKAGCYMFDPDTSAAPVGEVRYSALSVE